MRRPVLQGKGLRRLAGLMVVTAGVLVLFIFSVKLAARRASLSVQIARAPACLDPARMYSAEERLINGALYESLLAYDPEKHQVRGVLAERWESDRSGRVYTFYLRKNVRFHDGSQVTARDVKYSWERILNPGISGYGYLLQNVAGADDSLERRSSGVKGLEVVDASTLRVTLKETDWTFPAVVSSPALAVVNRRVVEREGLRYGRPGSRVLGTGSFRLARWNREYLLLRSSRWHVPALPPLRTLCFRVVGEQRAVKRLFEDGKLDILAGVPPNFGINLNDHQLPWQVFRKPVLGTYFLGFNLRAGSVCSDKVTLRRGIAQAIDKEQLQEELLGEGGRVLNEFLPPELLPSDRQVAATFSREAALKSLVQAGFPYGLNLSPLVYAYNDSPGNATLARLLQEQLGQVGVDVHLQKLPWDGYQTGIKSSGIAFFRLGWEADYPEAGNLLYNNFVSGQAASNNLTGYSNRDLDQLLRQARFEPDPARRDEIYSEANRLITSEVPVIPLFQRVATFFLHRDITGFQVDLLGMVDFARVRKL